LFETRTCYVAQALNSRASSSPMLGLQVCITMPHFNKVSKAKLQDSTCLGEMATE
jgi:hypothetical protein